MSHQCPFPVRASDTRRCYRTGTVPGFTLSLTLVAILSGYAGLADAAPAGKPAAVAEIPASLGDVVGYARGRVLVAPRAGLSEKEFSNILKARNAKSKGRFHRTNTYVLELPADADAMQMVQAMKKDKRLKYVELDYILKPAASVTDPNYASSWALPKIQAPAAWDTAVGSGVTIAILDTGVDGNHPDLKANMVPGWNMYDDNSNTSDVNGHGTKVAGTAAMVGNNGAGSAGVAYGARIMPVRISGTDGLASISTIAQGINWAADNGAKVVNISYAVANYSTVQSAANYMRSKGGVVVVAAGNNGALQTYAAEDSMLNVAATDSNDAKASWSNYGDAIDVAAPGVSIYSTTNGGGYANVSGTSFASPVTAATVALMLSANSRLTPGDVDKLIKSTALDLGTAGFDQYFGFGRIDAGKAVLAAKSAASTTPVADTQAPTISIAKPNGGKVSGVVAVDVTYSDNVGVTRAELYLNGNRIATDDTSPFAFSWDTAGYVDGSYTLMAKAYDAAGNAGSSSPVSVTPSSTRKVSVPKQTISASATDDTRVAKLSLYIDSREVATTTGSSISYGWSTRRVSSGAHTLTVRAWDAAGNTTSKSVTVYR